MWLCLLMPVEKLPVSCIYYDHESVSWGAEIERNSNTKDEVDKGLKDFK